jgi:hypothetical protein
MASSSILLYGRDPLLLETRSLVLERSGYRIWTASALRDLEHLPDTKKIDILILCHSVPLEESGRALAFCQSRWPLMRCLMLSGPDSWCTPGVPQLVFEIAHGPARLLSTLGALLNQEASSYSQHG